MKKLVFLMAMGLVFLASCAHVPDKDMLVRTIGPLGPALLMLEKGYLDKDKHGKNWVYLEELRGKKE